MSKVDVFMPTHEKRTFAVSQLNAVELARTLSWRENALFEEREKNNQLVHLPICLLANLSTRQLASLCQLFSGKFNIISALSGHQSLTLPQKIDSREGLFWCQKGLVCEYDKMNIYFKKPPFVPHLGLFVAKCTVICSKTQCNMPQNTVRFGAKCSAFWC